MEKTQEYLSHPDEKISSMELEQYSRLIESLALSQDEKLFGNSGARHAEIVLSTIFNNAEKNLKIFAKGLTSSVAKSDLYISSLKRFLDKGGLVSILIQEFTPDLNRALYDVLKYYQYESKVQIRLSNCTVIDNKNKPLHFTIGDSKMFRLEEDIQFFKAYGSFNSPEMSNKLEVIFDQIFISEKTQSVTIN